MTTNEQQKRWTDRRNKVSTQAKGLLKQLEADNTLRDNFWRVWHVKVAQVPYDRIVELEEQVEYLIEQLKLRQRRTDPPLLPMNHTYEI